MLTQQNTARQTLRNLLSPREPVEDSESKCAYESFYARALLAEANEVFEYKKIARKQS